MTGDPPSSDDAGRRPPDCTSSGSSATRAVTLDAVTAAFALGVAVSYGVAVDVRVRPLAAVVGSIATLAFEGAALSSEARRRRVRTVWERPTVRVGTTAISAVLAAAAALVAPDRTVSTVVAALLTYLTVLSATIALDQVRSGERHNSPARAGQDVRRLVPYLVAAPLVAGIGLVLWQLTTLPAVRAVSPFAILAAGIVGFGLGRRRPGSADVADLSSLLGVALVALAVFSLAFVTRWWGRVGFPLFGVIGVGLAAYGVGHRVDDEKGVRWRLTRDLDGNDGTSQSDRPWLDEDPEWTPDDREGDGTSREE